MKYCRRCRVYIEEDIEKCPLCHKKLVNMGQESAKEPVFSTGRLSKAEDQESFWIERKKTDSMTIKKRIIGFYTIITLSAILILIGIDISLIKSNKGFVFHTYKALVSLIFSYAFLSVINLFYRKILSFWLAGLVVSLFLVALDFSDKHLTWSLFIGIPVTWAIMLPVIIPFSAWQFSKVKGYNIIAWFFFGLGLCLMLIDFATSSYHHETLRGWSIITLGIFTALTIFFLYMHYGLKIHVYLDRIFHLRRRGDIE